jgi:hypothetical protein
MIWVLIIFVVGSGGVVAEFDDAEACHYALNEIKLQANNHRTVYYVCAPKATP